MSVRSHGLLSSTGQKKHSGIPSSAALSPSQHLPKVVQPRLIACNLGDIKFMQSVLLLNACHTIVASIKCLLMPISHSAPRCNLYLRLTSAGRQALCFCVCNRRYGHLQSLNEHSLNETRLDANKRGNGRHFLAHVQPRKAQTSSTGR